MVELHLKQPGITYNAYSALPNIVKEFKNLDKQVM